MHSAHPSSMVVAALDDNMMRLFPIVQVEVKIQVPDQLIGRLIGKNGHCLKKVMDETSTYIAISDSRNQHEVHQYRNQELFERMITIRGNNLNTVLLAEKNVQQKLRQFYEQDQNLNQPQYYNAPGVIVNQVENIGPYMAPGSVPTQIIPRDNTYPAAAYNALPMGVSPQPFYIQNPAAAVANFSIPTGQYAHNVPSVPNMPTNSVHIKSRVYVPNQIVGILIGAKGQTIKSVIADSGAIISIEGDRDPKKVKKELTSTPHHDNNNKDGNSSANNSQQNSIPTQQEQGKEPSSGPPTRLDMKSIADVEPIAVIKKEPLEKNIETEGKEDPVTEQKSTEDSNPKETTEQQPKQHPQEVNGSQHRNSTPQSVETSQYNGGKRANQIGPDQRGVFIQGYDYQVYKALSWVFQKVAESQNVRFEEMVLICEAIVPSKVIGRIIGKAGQNVKHLQCRTGAHIKVPDDINQQDKNCVEAAVRVVGNYFAVQSVQQHFGGLIIEAEWRESKEYDERRSRFRESSR